MKLLNASGWLGMAALVAAGALSGCGAGVQSASTESTFSNGGQMTGAIHGGQQPVKYATVYLFAAGTAGYGSGSASSPLATYTSTGTDGSFTFVKGTGTGASSGTGTSWECPATGNPQIYLVSVGGNPQLSGGADTDRNSELVLAAALGDCNDVTNSTYVVVDELSTAAAAFALAPYINAGTAIGQEVIGTNGVNYDTNNTTINASTPQGARGLNNAVLGIANLKATSKTYPGSGTAANITVTATPEANKMNTIADILASCVNSVDSAGSASANCQSLFAGAVSSAGASSLDTFQAAYYMATNPTDAGSAETCYFGSATSGTKTTINCLMNLSSSTAPFQNTLSAAPTDWTMGVTYSATGSCSTTSGGYFFDGPTHAAVDLNGNLWIMNQATSGTLAALVQMGPAGAPMQCVTPNSQTYGSSVTIDPTGNVWGLWSHSTVTNEIDELPYNSATGTVSTTPIGYTPLAGGSGNNVAGLVSDGYGDIFYTVPASGGTLYEIPNPASSATAVTQKTVATGFNGTSSTPYGYLAADSQGRIWGVSSASLYILGGYPTLAPITAYSASGSAVTFTAANSFTSGETVVISGMTSANGTQFNGQQYTITSATTTNFVVASTATAVSGSDSGTALETGSGSYTITESALQTTSYGLAIGGTGAASTYIYTGTTCCGSSAAHWAEKYTSAATAVASTGASAAAYLGGNIGARAVAVDGNATMWIGQEYPESTGSTTTSGTMGLAALHTVNGSGPTHVTFTAVSPTGTALTTTTCSTTVGCPSNGGIQKSAFTTPLDIEIDPSGNVWVLNTQTVGGGAYVSGTASTITEIVGAATPISTPLSTAAKNGTLGVAP